jgi:integrase
VTRRMVLDFALALEKFPARYPDAWRGRRVQEIIDLAKSRPDLRRMAPQTINDRCVGALKSFFSWCQKRRQLIDQNPAAGVALDIPKAAEKPRKPYKLEHLRLIFSQPVFVSGLRPKRGAGEAMYWIPLIALYSGMRLEEIGQLRTKDIRQEDSIWVFSLVEDEGETSLKTGSSERMIPIHKDLISRGLLLERDRQIAAGEARMFPLLEKNREGKYTAMFSKWWGLWSRQIGITDERLVFHSFRHSFKDRCRSSRIPVDVQDALLGHAGKTVGSLYGDGYDVRSLDEHVQRIDWSPVFSPHE